MSEIDDKIQNIIKGMFPNNKILLIYFSGSISYKTNTKSSDIDVTVIIKDLDGSLNIKIDSYDLYIYGVDYFFDRLNYKENIPLFELLKNDDVLNIEENIIYVDSDFVIKSVKETFDLKKHLISVLNYEELKEPFILEKRMCHILRLRGMVEHLTKSNQLEMIVEEPWKNYMMDYKENPKQSYKELIDESLHYLSSYVRRM